MTTTYSPNPGYQANPDFAPNASRTSLLAITSLVLGILSIFTCFLQVVGPLAILVGVIALVAIARSQGTLAGRGLAVSGMITGIVGVVLGVFLLLGTFFTVNQIGRYGQFVSDAQSRDQSATSAWLSPSSSASLDEATLETFADATDDALGSFGNVTPGLWAFFQSFPRIERLRPSDLQTYQSRGMTPIPMPAEFANGPATLVMIVSQREPMAGTVFGKVVNVAVIPEGSTKVIWLFDPAAPVPPMPVPGTQLPPIPSDPANGPAPVPPPTSDPAPTDG